MSQLAGVSLFSNLTTDQLLQLEQHATLRSFPRNSIIITEGDHSDFLYVMIAGSARVYCSDEEGREVTLNDLQVGDHFGELSLFDQKARSASIVATENCKLLMLDKAALLQVFRHSPDLALELIAGLTLRVRDLTQQIKNLALNDVYGRIVNTLLSLSETVAGERITRIPLTQQDIANRVGASREMVSRIMKDLVAGGYVQIEKKKIHICKDLPTHY